MYSEIVFSHILQRSKHYTQLSRGARVLNVNEAIEDKGQFLSLGVPCRIESIDCLRKFTDSLSRVEAPSTFNCTPNGGGGGETGWLHRSMAAFMNALFLFIFPLSSCAERFLPLISVIIRSSLLLHPIYFERIFGGLLFNQKKDNSIIISQLTRYFFRIIDVLSSRTVS